MLEKEAEENNGSRHCPLHKHSLLIILLKSASQTPNRTRQAEQGGWLC